MLFDLTLQRLRIYHYLQYIISSKESEALEKSLSTKDKDKMHYWMPVTFRPSDGTALKKQDSVTTWAQNDFQQSLCEHHSPPHREMQVIARSCKDDARYQVQFLFKRVVLLKLNENSQFLNEVINIDGHLFERNTL